jgi:N-glycosylase/DNA lyase|tara:strand:- start:1976 stop:2233 length:258 start_codon:yes stop_codon:yes gene_type:complete
MKTAKLTIVKQLTNTEFARKVKMQKVARLEKIKAEYSEMTTNACRNYMKWNGKYEDLCRYYVKLSNHYSDRQYKMDRLIDQVWGA